MSGGEEAESSKVTGNPKLWKVEFGEPAWSGFVQSDDVEVPWPRDQWFHGSRGGDSGAPSREAICRRNPP
ncbi:hypothetical protein HPP92_010424 [Vanilla planifolia]|uniref:Uncharacterized protein n=1 Tax=Vanilla planifolia TaxID=51239 RepID=A0A835R6F7_VANPL|nr:hypothetical protein HPP92_010424 [Vanilla planifolia]